MCLCISDSEDSQEFSNFHKNSPKNQHFTTDFLWKLLNILNNLVGLYLLFEIYLAHSFLFCYVKMDYFIFLLQEGAT